MIERILILLFINLSFCAVGQQIEKDEIDDFSGARKVSTKLFEGTRWKKTDFIDTKYSLLLSIGYSKEKKDKEDLYFISLGVLASAIKLGCLSQDDGKIILLLENDSTITLKQVSNTDCGNNALSATYIPLTIEQLADPLWIDILKKNIGILTMNRVKKIRIHGSEGYHDYELREDKMDIIMQHLKNIQSRIILGN